MTVTEQDGGLLHDDHQDIVIGIDQSYHGFGITAMATAGVPLYHSWLYASSGTGVKRVINIRDFLDLVDGQLRDRYCGLDTVAMEGYAPGAKFGREMAGELGGMVKVWLYEVRGMEPYLVAPTSLKKYVTGKGTGVQKNQMLLQTYKKWGVEFHDDNLCDSYGLARLVSGRHELAYEKEVYDKLKR